MTYNPQIHHRRSIRLKGYDYSKQGLYFITICCQNRASMFGQIIQSNFDMSPVGAHPCGRPSADYKNLDHIENKSPNESRPSADYQNLDLPENSCSSATQLENHSQEMQLNDAGQMIENEWLKLPDRFENILLHEYVIMPNHFHCILEITNDHIHGVGRPQGHAPTGVSTEDSTVISQCKTIGDMMDAFKSITTVEYIRGVKTKNWSRFNGKLWQRDYYEHIIRNERSYLTISNYIINNPQKWKADKFRF
jgi:putative transposase